MRRTMQSFISGVILLTTTLAPFVRTGNAAFIDGPKTTIRNRIPLFLCTEATAFRPSAIAVGGDSCLRVVQEIFKFGIQDKYNNCSSITGMDAHRKKLEQRCCQPGKSKNLCGSPPTGSISTVLCSNPDTFIPGQVGRGSMLCKDVALQLALGPKTFLEEYKDCSDPYIAAEREDIASQCCQTGGATEYCDAPRDPRGLFCEEGAFVDSAHLPDNQTCGHLANTLSTDIHYLKIMQAANCSHQGVAKHQALIASTCCEAGTAKMKCDYETESTTSPTTTSTSTTQEPTTTKISPEISCCKRFQGNRKILNM
eukprot:m.44344 g.44344  ORF g.44344 m.44344 type:complete len:311 (-) comp10085_c0_seq1:2798-3730(-)